MNAIRIFQENNGLTPDGVVGKKTFAKICEVFGISTAQAAHFLGQADHESGGFDNLIENMNYSAQRLAQVWPRRFALNATAKVKVPNSLAKRIANQPMLIGNIVYANRMGNGTDNGFRHRGFGAIMITGKDLQFQFADYIRDHQVKINPELIATKYPIESAIWYFNTRRLWRLCNEVNDASILTVSKVINIGNANTKLIPHGMEDRREKTYKYFQIGTKS